MATVAGRARAAAGGTRAGKGCTSGLQFLHAGDPYRPGGVGSRLWSAAGTMPARATGHGDCAAGARMAFQRVGEIIESIRGVHRRLRDCYANTAVLEGDGRVAWLLEYMGRHEQAIDEGLAAFQEETGEDIQETWLQYTPRTAIREALEDACSGPGMTPDEVVRSALRADAALIELYESLATMMLVPRRVQRFFEHLADLERAKSKEYSRRLAELRQEMPGEPWAGGGGRAPGGAGDGDEPRVHRRPAAGDAGLDAPAPPWSHNPSAWRERIPIAVLAGIAFLISVYLTLYQWKLIDSVWDPLFGEGSEKVLDSEASATMRSWIGIPDAALGAFAYLGDVVFGMAGSTRRWQYRPWMVMIFGLDVIPLGIVSAVLVVLQGAVVGAWCSLCLVTAAISLILVLLAYDEVWSSLLYLRRVWQRRAGYRELWRCFWGLPSAAARRAA